MPPYLVVSVMMPPYLVVSVMPPYLVVSVVCTDASIPWGVCIDASIPCGVCNDASIPCGVCTDASISWGVYLMPPYLVFQVSVLILAVNLAGFRASKDPRFEAGIPDFMNGIQNLSIHFNMVHRKVDWRNPKMKSSNSMHVMPPYLMFQVSVLMPPYLVFQCLH